MRFPAIVLLGLSLVSVPALNASEDTLGRDSVFMDETYLRDSINRSFVFQDDGMAVLGNGLASLRIPDGFKYLDPEQSARVLTDLWGNPPSETMGMLFPDDMYPASHDFTFAIEISYSEEGYVEDDDARDLDYDELLEQMQKDIEAGNEYRTQQGYGSMTLVGWATQPFYDAEHKKLYWAKELYFEDETSNTLNYDVRILGRKGFLSMNAISGMDQLPLVQANIEPVINSVNFNEGYAYKDFDPEIDKIAAYGIGGLITGKILAKAGVFAIILKFWKFIAIGAVAAFGAFRKQIAGWFGGKSDTA